MVACNHIRKQKQLYSLNGTGIQSHWLVSVVKNKAKLESDSLQTLSEKYVHLNIDTEKEVKS